MFRGPRFRSVSWIRRLPWRGVETEPVLDQIVQCDHRTVRNNDIGLPCDEVRLNPRAG